MVDNLRYCTTFPPTQHTVSFETKCHIVWTNSLPLIVDAHHRIWHEAAAATGKRNRIRARYQLRSSKPFSYSVSLTCTSSTPVNYIALYLYLSTMTSENLLFQHPICSRNRYPYQPSTFRIARTLIWPGLVLVYSYKLSSHRTATKLHISGGRCFSETGYFFPQTIGDLVSKEFFSHAVGMVIAAFFCSHSPTKVRRSAKFV